MGLLPVACCFVQLGLAASSPVRSGHPAASEPAVGCLSCDDRHLLGSGQAASGLDTLLKVGLLLVAVFFGSAVLKTAQSPLRSGDSARHGQNFDWAVGMPKPLSPAERGSVAGMRKLSCATCMLTTSAGEPHCCWHCDVRSAFAASGRGLVCIVACPKVCALTVPDRSSCVPPSPPVVSGTASQP